MSPRNAFLWPARIALAAVLLALVGLAVRVPMGAPPQRSELLLSWRTVGERVRVCRPYTEEELERLPEHMRREEKCSNRSLAYRLTVAVDGHTLQERRVVAAGLRHDRPLFVHEALSLEPGTHTVRVRFAPSEVPADELASTAEREAYREAVRKGKAFTLERTLRFERGQVHMIDLDPQRRTLFLATG